MLEWQKRLQPAPEKQFGPDNAAYTFNQRFLSILIGTSACALAPLLWLLAEYSPDICQYWSLSHYYYAPLVGNLFVGVLFIIGALLIGYGGENWVESFTAKLGGVFALGVAALPTKDSGCVEKNFAARGYTEFSTTGPGAADPIGALDGGGYFQLYEGVAIHHYASAAGLFVVMAFYTLFIFTRPTPGPDGRPLPATTNKMIRNVIYILCGLVILVCMGALLAYWRSDGWPEWNEGGWTFKFEAVALMAFGSAWLVKSKPLGFLGDERDRLLRHKQEEQEASN